MQVCVPRFFPALTFYDNPPPPPPQGLSDIPDLVFLCLRYIPASLIPRAHSSFLPWRLQNSTLPSHPACPGGDGALPPDPGLAPARTQMWPVSCLLPRHRFSVGPKVLEPQTWSTHSLGPLTSGQGDRARHPGMAGVKGQPRKALWDTEQSPWQMGVTAREAQAERLASARPLCSAAWASRSGGRTGSAEIAPKVTAHPF